MVSQLESTSVNSTLNLPYPYEGLIQVFTSTHRSFFTNVMAQALRIAGQGNSVLIAQFLKGGIRQGHNSPVKLGHNLEWIRCDLPRRIDTPHLDESELDSLRILWQHTQKVVLENKYSLVVLDELSLAMNFGLISEEEVLAFLKQRPIHIDIIFTGSEMPRSILDLADQVTEIRHTHKSE